MQTKKFQRETRFWQVFFTKSIGGCMNLQKKWDINIFSRGLRDSTSHCVGPSDGWSVCQLVCPAFAFSPFSAFCERFLHHCSCPMARDWCCRVYGTPHCPCPPHHCPCPTSATDAGSCVRPCLSEGLWKVLLACQILELYNLSFMRELTWDCACLMTRCKISRTVEICC